MTKLNFNNVSYTCPFSDAMPPLTADERAELKGDIEKNGILYDVIVTDENEVIDGHHRLAIAVELGLTAVPMKVIAGLSPDEKQRRAEDLNLHRRHLTHEQKRAIIARRLRADPTVSNNTIASSVGADGKTVATQRKKLESTSEIPKLAATRGKDGKTRKATRSPVAAQKPEPKQANASACATLEEAADEHQDAQSPGTKPVKCKPVKLNAWWPRLDKHATTVESIATDLRKLAKSKPAECNPASVLEVARLLRQSADDLENTVRGK